MTSIKAQVLVLFEGQSNQVFHNPQVVHWLEKTSTVLSELKDLCKEVAAAPKMRKNFKYMKLIFKQADTGSFCREMSQKVKHTMEELEATDSEGKKLGQLLAGLAFGAASETRRPETYAYISENKVIGRDEEKRELKQMILSKSGIGDDEKESISVIPVVGFSGIGKTALAQLVYIDPHVDRHFDLKAWVCFPHGCTLAGLAVTIFSTMFGELGEGGWPQDQLQAAVEDKTYLLVLDDVWDEDCKTWLQLWNLKCLGGRGSKIIVTTSSKEVAQIMGTRLPYELRGLQEDKSWELFKRMALSGEQDGTISDLTTIGSEIVKKCANIPLAIRSVSAMLRGHKIRTWVHIRDMESIIHCRSPEGNGSLLLLAWEQSYNRLPEHVKQCLLYCSLFPKGYEFYESDLIHLWIAQGVIGPSHGSGSSVWDLGSQCLMKLVNRYFLQDAKKDGSGNTISWTIDVLMFEFVQHLARDEFFIISDLSPFDEFRYSNLSHLSFIIDSHWEAPMWLPAAEKLQSLFLLPRRHNPLVGSDFSASCWLYEFTNSTYLDKMFSSLRVLCALDLAAVNCESLPSSVGKLTQLRYLRLGVCESLPLGITRLLNLEILDLRLSLVRRLPTDFNELINLKHLHIGDTLIHLLPVFWKLRTSLQKINLYGAGENNELTAVASLNDIDGKVKFHHDKNPATATSNVTAEFLNDQERAFLSFTWSLSSAAMSVSDSDKSESWLPEPPPHLEFLGIWCRGGMPLPNNHYKNNYSPTLLSLRCWQWETNVFSFLLPTLVSLNIENCSGFHHLTAISWLPNLKNLRLWNLNDLEYIEDETEGNNKCRISSDEAVASYFPSLERLELYELHQLKEWFRGEYRLPPVPHLVELKVSGCPNLKWMPQVQRLESLEAYEIHEGLLNHLLIAQESEKLSTYPPSTVKELYIASIRELYSFSVDEFSVESLTITTCQQLFDLTVSNSAISCLRQLEIASCGRLRGISGVLQKLSVLEELVVDGCNNLDWGNTEGLEGLKSLRSLTVKNMMKPDSIPSGLGCLTMLQELHISWLYNLRVLPGDIGQLRQLQRLGIRYCYKLSALPDSFGNLKDLQHLRIVECPKLERRCRQPDGKDWHLIQHIPDIVVGTNVITLQRTNSSLLKHNG